MGGNALKNTETERKSPQDYDAIKTAVLDRLKQNDIECCVVKEMPEKTSYGDLDVLYKSSPSIDIRQLIRNLFPEHSEIVSNGPVTSFDYQKFQIDLIRCTPETYAMSQFYFSYGDTGMLIGKLMRSHDILYGNEGIWIQTDDGRLDLSSDPVAICAFAGLDYDRWLRGFQSKHDIFAWIKSCRFYRPQAFLSQNATDRRRISHRPMYEEFAQMAANEATQMGQSADSKTASMVDEAIVYFGKQETLEEMRRIKQRDLDRKAKFSGKTLLDLGVPQMQIGALIGDFKKFIESEFSRDYHEWLDSHDANFCLETVKRFLAQHNNK